MPLDPAKLQQVVDKADSITKRLDALTTRRAKNDADKAQRKVLRDAEETLKADRDFETRREDDAPPEKLEQPKDIFDPWYFNDGELGYERSELRQGDLSKDQF